MENSGKLGKSLSQFATPIHPILCRILAKLDEEQNFGGVKEQQTSGQKFKKDEQKCLSPALT